MIERGVLVAKGSEITVNDLPESLRTENATTTLELPEAKSCMDVVYLEP